jgi:hypothetical protein
MWKKNIVELGGPQTKIWRKRIACWIPKAADTHSENVIITAFLQQHLLHESASCYAIFTLPVWLKVKPDGASSN